MYVCSVYVYAYASYTFHSYLRGMPATLPQGSWLAYPAPLRSASQGYRVGASLTLRSARGREGAPGWPALDLPCTAPRRRRVQGRQTRPTLYRNFGQRLRLPQASHGGKDWLAAISASGSIPPGPGPDARSNGVSACMVVSRENLSSMGDEFCGIDFRGPESRPMWIGLKHPRWVGEKGAPPRRKSKDGTRAAAALKPRRPKSPLKPKATQHGSPNSL